MSERRAWKPRPADERQRERRKEWVSLDDGDVCVWEMRTQETTTLIQKAQRPEKLGGGSDALEDALWTCILTCYQGDEPDAKPCWGNPPTMEDIKYILALRAEELGRINQAAQRVSGLTEEEIGEVRDFIVPSEGGMPSPSSRSVSGNSAAALKS
jgi:hypothetical protein